LYIAADEDTIVEFMLDVASYRLEPDAIEQPPTPPQKPPASPADAQPPR